MKTLLLISLLFLSACATTYQRNGFSGGYDEIKLGEDLYQVSFKGNGYTGTASVQKNFLRRCAELTLTDKYDYFVFVEQETEANKYDMGTTYKSQITPNYYGGYTSTGTAQTTSFTKHGRTGVIKLFKKGEQPKIAYDARQVLQSLGVRIIEGSDEDDRAPANAEKP